MADPLYFVQEMRWNGWMPGSVRDFLSKNAFWLEVGVMKHTGQAVGFLHRACLFAMWLGAAIVLGATKCLAVQFQKKHEQNRTKLWADPFISFCKARKIRLAPMVPLVSTCQ